MKCNQSRPGFELVSPCPFPTTITITPRAPPLSLFSNPLFNRNFHFLAICFTLINRFRHQPVSISAKENFGSIHVGYSHIQANTRILKFLLDKIYLSQNFFPVKKKKKKCDIKEKFLMESKMICASRLV